MKYYLLGFMFLVSSCMKDPKFYLGQKVLIKHPFYRGCIGIVRNLQSQPCSAWYSYYRYYYQLEEIECPYKKLIGLCMYESELTDKW